MKRLASLLLTVVALFSFLGISTAETDITIAPMNRYVMKVVESFPTDGSNPYWWPKTNEYDGATTDVYFMGKKVMRGDPADQCRSYCCGLTLQVFYLALQEYEKAGNTIPPYPLTPEKSGNFKWLWFCPEVKSPGPLLALEEYKMGRKITHFEEAIPGDFVQLWRNNGSGHSVIFIDWERDDTGKIKALKYWSTQPVTKGIGLRVEPIGGGDKDITREHLYIGRLDLPDKWPKPQQ